MVVDDADITSLIEKTDIELGITGTRKSNLKQLLRNLKAIEKPVDPTDETKRIMPIDRGVGGDMKPARRQAIYDKILIDKTELDL